VVEGLHVAGHELQLVRPRQDKSEAAAQDERFAEVLMRGLPIPRYPQLRMGLPSKRALVQRWTLRRPDVVHIVTEGPLGYSALQAATQLKLPVVSDFRTNFQAYSKLYGIAWLRTPIMSYLRKFHNRTACTMVPTDGLRGELMLAGFKNLRVVSRGVDTRLFDPARRNATLRATWDASANDLVAICVGRLAPEKNLTLLMDAFEALQAREPRAKLVVVGDGPLRAALQQRCPTAIFSGMQSGENLATHYASADLFLFPSTTETFGNVLPEAMASGLAVVAYDYAAARQLVRHGDNGLLVPFDDGAAFCAAAERLAGQLCWVRAMGREGRLTAKRQDWASIVELVEQTYLGAMSQPMRAPRAAWRPALPL
jgi:glycosyltransferase involved in cell wall biosynthesis